jgi:hypothetical protein
MADNAVAYGFISLKNVWSDRITTIGGESIADAVAQSLAEYNRQADALMGDMVQRTTDRTRTVLIATGGDLQPVDEWGNPLPVRSAGSYDVGFPIQGGATAWGDNRISRQLMTVEEANRNTLAAMAMDARWIRRHLMAAILDNTSWTFNDPQGDITIQPLANNDTVTYLGTSGTSAVAQHYTAGTGVFTQAQVATMRDLLLGYPGNSGDVIVYVASDLVDDVEAMTGFVAVADPDVLVGSSVSQLTNRIDPSFGDVVLGKVERTWVVEWRYLPSGYAVARIGNRPFVAMREYPSPALQGFFSEMHSSDGNLREMRLLRYAGFGVFDRTAAAVHQAGTATYTIPSGFSTPLAS